MTISWQEIETKLKSHEKIEILKPFNMQNLEKFSRVLKFKVNYKKYTIQYWADHSILFGNDIVIPWFTGMDLSPNHPSYKYILQFIYKKEFIALIPLEY